jgi:N-acetylglucosamine kinase-like BadF-type ATPase
VILIAESGSTTTEWCLVDDGVMIEHFTSDGINPFFQTRKEISHLIRLSLPSVFFKAKAEVIYFYGAGCSVEEKKSIVKASLESQLKARAQIESDLYGAARALFQQDAGIACILDTGSNSCFYDGEKIVKNVLPLGYILGDEGSGAALGKAFVADCLKKIAPEMIIRAFYEKYKVTADDIVDLVYTKPFPNRLLSEMSFFLSDHLYHSYVQELVYTNLKSFFVRNILQYDYAGYPVRFVGTVADMYLDLILPIAKEMGIQIDMIVKNPMKGLIRFHENSNNDGLI